MSIAVVLSFREFMLVGAMSACWCDYLADLKSIIEQRVTRGVRKGSVPREITFPKSSATWERGPRGSTTISWPPAALLLQRVSFNQRHTGGVVFAAHYRGVTARSQSRDNRRLPVVCRRQ